MASIPLKIKIGPSWGSVDRGIKVLAKQVNNQVVFIIVNEWVDPLSYTISGLHALNGITYKDTRGIHRGIVQDDKLSLTAGGHEVYVLTPAN